MKTIKKIVNFVTVKLPHCFNFYINGEYLRHVGILQYIIKSN